ncbi:LysR family transcriptional regulator [Pseudotabrizicola sediminis]|uniref:LysR family transcriptional regulator n=1 Tax=Pseudotabrizicola sediminis TaxID=2486418 RepID=A0ABY2KMV1_9RHOB|nr:LysR substrate-binding domain-containing protein [Pseudotabrizicola sediminis]TGD43878.1 LysR family transcriptional regulator [Pseudotabrizicola sediminis]TGD65590.1 LysR family transcriptional regulator [Tabrizicola sp. WMC-M-20]
MPLRFTLRQLEYLVAVGEAGSIAVAAERVSVSSPSISAAIAHLEQEFGLQLFVRRHAQGLTLTSPGRQIFDHARQVLAQAGQLNDLAGSITQTVQGRLHVGGLITFAQVILPQLRRSFTALHPQVEFHQSEGDQSDLYDGLRNATLDAALGYDLDSPADLEFVPLASLTPYAVLAASHPLAGQDSLTPQDLAPHPMVLLDLPLSADYFLSCFHAAGVRPRIVERTRDMGVMHSLVGQGFGYSIANIRPWSDRSPDGQPLRFVPLAGAVRPMRLGLILPVGARSSLTLRAFVGHCQGQLTPEKVRSLSPSIDPGSG